MSVATEFPPVVHVPERARRRAATVLPFRPRALPATTPVVAGPGAERPAASLRDAADAVSRRYPVRPAPARRGVSAARSSAAARGVAPVRLTRRGYVVLAVAGAVLAAGLLWLAHASATAVTPEPVRSVPAVVTVHDGDTLWSIASRLAPQRDPRAVVVELERLNGLASPELQPGQRLRTR